MNFYIKALVAALFLSISINAQALETSWKGSPENEGQAKVIYGGESDSGNAIAGLNLKFKENWHTYWKRSGETGMPLTLTDKGSKNIKNFEIDWVAPKRLSMFGIESWVYEGELTLPLSFDIIDKAQESELNLELKWAICHEICLFEKADFSLKIPANYKNESNFSKITEALEYKVNMAANSSKVSLKDVTILDDKIITTINSETAFNGSEDLFIFEESKNFKFPKPQISYSADKKTMTIIANYSALVSGKNLVGKTIEMTLAAGKSSTSFNYTNEAKLNKNEELKKNSSELSPQETSAEEPKKKKQISLFYAIIFAIIGGLILNVMPCVLPVLSIKVLGMMKNHGEDKTYIRKSFLFTILGIICSFLVIAAFTASLKSAGQIAGWGTQFQNSGFLIFLGLLCFLFSLNLMGFFEVYLPSLLGGKLNDTINKSEKSPLVANFLTGAFATLLATPCTAPFLSTAIAFSLSSSSATIFIIFFFMGVGLALPYIIFMIFPSAVRFLPKPGAWMEKVKILFGIMLFATFLWLVFIIISSGRMFAGIMLFQLCLVIWGFCWYAKRKQLDTKKTLLSVAWGIFCIFLVCIWLAENIEKPRPEMDKLWVEFSQEKLDKLISEDKIIFIDVTADWCLTCKFNKANTVLPMLDYFKENNVVLMRADYTNSSLEIAKYLSKNGAYAIPYNKVYGPNNKGGIQLPVLLKREVIINAVEQVR